MTAAPTREPTYVADDLAEPDLYFPVVLVEHKQHVIWVEATNPDEAAETVRDDPEWYERIRDNGTLSDFWYEANTPSRYEWHTVLNGGEGYESMLADAHVRTHEAMLGAARREEARAACAAAGHPDIQFGYGDPYCTTCGRALKPEQLVADIRAAARVGQVAA